MDLVDRNLVIVTKKRFYGEIDTCSIHDMLRDLCIKKISEEESLRVLHLCEWVHNNSSIALHRWIPDPIGKTFCVHSHCSCEDFARGSCAPYVRILFNNCTKLFLYRFLRVLDLDDVTFPTFPTFTLQLTHLKYLALSVQRVGMCKLGTDSLRNLETFILRHGGETNLVLGKGIFEMAKLRHLYIYPSFKIEMPWACFPNYLVLAEMQTMTTLESSSHIQDVLSTTPNLRKLGFYLNEKNYFTVPDFSGMTHLETLEINWFSTLYNKVPAGISDPRAFPPNLKKLTLTTGYLDWKEMAIIGLLPKLEVLKVRYNCFTGPVWKTSVGGFCDLKFLELRDLKQWISSDYDHFPNLQFLLVIKCRLLHEIPLSFGDSPTLQRISVYHSSKSSEDSAYEIQKMQLDMGYNDQFKLFFRDNDNYALQMEHHLYNLYHITE